jgi:hypothetical protein
MQNGQMCLGFSIFFLHKNDLREKVMRECRGKFAGQQAGKGEYVCWHGRERESGYFFPIQPKWKKPIDTH